MGGAIVFWLLVVLAMTAFTPCVLLPAWRAYEAAYRAEHAAAHRRAALERLIEREQRTLDAIRTDPAAVARLAKRDLGYRDPREAAMSWPVVPTIAPASVRRTQYGVSPAVLNTRPHTGVVTAATATPSTRAGAAPDQPARVTPARVRSAVEASADDPAAGDARAVAPMPAPLAAAVSHLPDLDYDAVFCDPPTRRVVMVMSVAVLVTAFALFGRRPMRTT
ncbi:MAG: hypothetical protein ACE5E6_00480 [Phycisphaerae bacterium]